MTAENDVYSTGKLLSGLRVLDIGNNIAGPVVATILGGLGAEVIKVERPEGGDNSRYGPPFAARGGISGSASSDPAEDPVSIGFMKRNRGKASVTLDLKDEGDRQKFLDLAATADVVVENGLPGKLAKLGIGFDVLKARNPGLILCSVTGFGQSGPCSSWGAYDAIIQAHSGTFADVHNFDAASGTMVADMAGCLYGVISVLAALFARGKVGQGAWLDVSMLEATIAFAWESNRDVVQRQRDRGESVRRVAPWNAYPTTDGRVMICAYTDRQFQILKKIVGIDTDEFDIRNNRLKRAEELDAKIGEWTRVRTKWEVSEILQSSHIPTSPILNPLEVIESPQVVERRAFEHVEHPRLGTIDVVTPQFPLWINQDTHLEYDPSAPELGEHNDQLADLTAGKPVVWSHRKEGGQS